MKTKADTEPAETEAEQFAAPPEPIDSEFQPIQGSEPLDQGRPTTTSKSDFSSSNSTRLEIPEIVEGPPAPPASPRENSFQVVGYRQAKADTKAGFHNARIGKEIRSDAGQKQQIILPKFKFSNPITSSPHSQTQLTAMTTQNAGLERLQDNQFETPWLSPWWMLIGLIPLALYIGTTKLFRDDDESAYYGEDLDSSKAFKFDSDFGKNGGSKSDSVYGNDDTLSKIQSTIRQANRQPKEAIPVKTESVPTRSTVAFAESLIFEEPTSEAGGISSIIKELSPNQSPNFSNSSEAEIAAVKRKKARNKKSSKKSRKQRR